jgi:uncharacterized membrane protein (UPF0127 family)
MHKFATTLKIILILLGTLVAVVAVQTFSGTPRQAQSLLTNTATTHVAVRLHNIKINSELARTSAEQAHGLSGRPGLGELDGLLFVFPEEVTPAFWMQDMLFPIDIVWLNKNWQVVGMVKNFRPDSYPQTVEPPVPVHYVLEVNAGLTDELNLQVGERAVVSAQ